MFPAIDSVGSILALSTAKTELHRLSSTCSIANAGALNDSKSQEYCTLAVCLSALDSKFAKNGLRRQILNIEQPPHGITELKARSTQPVDEILTELQYSSKTIEVVEQAKTPYKHWKRFISTETT